MLRRGRHKVVDYPYKGKIYDTAIDYTVPLAERDVHARRLVREFDCDIQEVSKAANPILIATFSVFIPYSRELETEFRRGMEFEGYARGLDIAGMITNVVVSELDGIVVYVKDYDANEID